MEKSISIPAAKLAGDEHLEQKIDLLKDKLLHNKVGTPHYKRMPFVTFFLYMLMAFFVLSAFVEMGPTHCMSWIDYDVESPYVVESSVFECYGFIVLIVGILSAINAISAILILKTKRKGFWIIACCSAIVVFILTLCSQYFNINYNSIGNLVLLKNLFIPFILWAVLNIKDDNGESLWQYLN